MKGVKIDIRKLLEDYGIEYWDRGKNIMKNFVGVRCWNCGDDPSHHLNLREDGWFALCFRCGIKIKGVKNVIEFVLGRDVNSGEFIKFLKKYRVNGVFADREERVDRGEKCVSDVEKAWDRFGALRSVDIRYLENRGISEVFARRWGLRGGKGDYLYYVMIPIRDLNGELVGFVGRDTTGKSEKRFLNFSGSVRKYLFGLYECKEWIKDKGYVVIVEGVFDVLKAQQGGIVAVGLMGKMMSDDQLGQLLKVTDRGTRVFVLLDSDAENEAKELVECLKSYFDNVYLVKLGECKDIGDMDIEGVMRLKSLLENA